MLGKAYLLAHSNTVSGAGEAGNVGVCPTPTFMTGGASGLWQDGWWSYQPWQWWGVGGPTFHPSCSGGPRLPPLPPPPPSATGKVKYQPISAQKRKRGAGSKAGNESLWPTSLFAAASGLFWSAPVRCAVCGVWCAVCGARCTAHGVWCMVRGVWCVVRRVRWPVRGVLCAVRGVWCLCRGSSEEE